MTSNFFMWRAFWRPHKQTAAKLLTVAFIKVEKNIGPPAISIQNTFSMWDFFHCLLRS